MLVKWMRKSCSSKKIGSCCRKSSIFVSGKIHIFLCFLATAIGILKDGLTAAVIAPFFSPFFKGLIALHYCLSMFLEPRLQIALVLVWSVFSLSQFKEI